MADDFQLGNPMGSFAGGPDPLASAEIYLNREELGTDDPFAIRPYEIAKQVASGYLSGFSTFPMGEVSDNRVEQMARQLGHLGGFIGFGFPKNLIRNAGRDFLAKQGLSSAASAAAQFRSFPMMAADLLVGKANKTKAVSSAMSYLDKSGRLASRQFIQEATHLGIASGASAWTEGINAMAVAGFQGGILGGGTAMLANLPILRDRDTVGNILRTISGAIVDAAPAYFMGGDSIDMAYSAILGGYFGYRQPSAQMARAQEYYYRELDSGARGNKGRLFHKGSNFFNLPDEVQTEVRKLIDLDKHVEVGAGLEQIKNNLEKAFGIEPSDESGPVVRKERAERQKIYDVLALRGQYNTGSIPGRSIIQFSEILSKLPDAGLKDWDAFEVASLVESVGNQAKIDGLDFPTFRSTLSSTFEQATGAKLTEKQTEPLRNYFFAKSQNKVRPTFGVDSDFGLVQFNKGKRDFSGSLIETEDTINIVNGIQRANGLLADDAPDFSGHITIVDYNERVGKRLKRQADTNKIPIGDLLNPGNIFAKMKDGFFDVEGDDGSKTRIPLYDKNGRSRFYLAHGEADKNKFHFLLYNVNGNAASQIPDIKKAFGEGNEEAYNVIESRSIAAMVEGGMKPQRAREEFERQFVSNINYWRDMNGGMSIKDLVSREGFIGDVADFNKRLQPLFNNYYRPDKTLFDSSIKYMVVNDLNDFATVGKPKIDKATGEVLNRIGAEVTDGSVMVSDLLFDKLMSMTNLKDQTGSSLKPFILSQGNDEGLLIGKMAFHRADAGTQLAMKKAGVDMMIHNTAAKQRGKRPSHNYKLNKDGFQIGSGKKWKGIEDTDILEMSPQDIMLSLDTGDNVQRSAKLAKQIGSMLASEQLEYRISGNNVEHFADRLSATKRERAFYDEVVHKGLTGDSRVTALDDYIRLPSDEGLEALFGGDNPSVERVDKVNLFNEALKPGNEKLYDRMNQYLVGRRDMFGDDDEVGRYDDNDSDRDLALLSQSMDQRTPFDIIFDEVKKSGRSTHAAMLSHSAQKQMSQLYSNWIVSAMTKPVWNSAFKAVLKPITPGVARGITYNGEQIHFGAGDNYVRDSKVEDLENIDTQVSNEPIEAKKFDVGSRIQTEDFNVWEIISKETYALESRLGLKSGVKARFITNVNPNENRRQDYLNPDSPSRITLNSVSSLPENTLAIRISGEAQKTTPKQSQPKNEYIPDLNENTYLLEGGLRDYEITATQKEGEIFREVKRRLEDVFEDFRTTSDDAYRGRLREDLTGILARVPIADISGSQDLVFAGFTNTKGKGVILHEKTMRRLGGADLDIDTAFVYMGMPKGMKEIVNANRNNQKSFDTALQIGEDENGKPIYEDSIGLYLRSPEDLPGLPKLAPNALRKMAMFDPYHRTRIAQEVSRARSDLTGMAVNNRMIVQTMYSHARQYGELLEPLSDGEHLLRYTPRDDNGVLLRARSNGAVQATVDVPKFGAMAEQHEMMAIQMDGAFSRIDVVNKNGDVIRNILDENTFVRVGTELHLNKKETNLFDILLRGKEKVEIGFAKNDLKFSLGDTLIQRLRDVNSVFFGSDRTSGRPRPYTLDDKVEAAKFFPEDNEGRPLKGYLYELSRTIQTIKPQNISLLDYVLSDFSRFETSFKEISDYVNRNKATGIKEDLPFFYDDKGRVPIPSKSFISQLRMVKPYMERGNAVNIRTDHGRGLMAANDDLYFDFVKKVRSVDNVSEGEGSGLAQYFPSSKSGLKKRKTALSKINSEINRFVEHGAEEIVGIPLVKQMFISSGMKSDEARKLLEGATYLKGAFAKRYAEDLSRAGRDRTEQGASRREKSASKNARDLFEREYRRLLSSGSDNDKRDLPDLFKKGMYQFLSDINSTPERTNGSEQPISYEGVRNLFDAFLISPYGSTTVNDRLRKLAEEKDNPIKPTAAESALSAVRTESRSIGLDVAGPSVVQEYVRQFDNVFGSLHVKKVDNVSELMRGSIGKTEAEKRWASVSEIQRTIYPKGVELSKEIQDSVDTISKIASTYPEFAKDPESVLKVMRHFYGKAQPEDFTLSELKGFESVLKRWKNGGTFLTKLLRDGFGMFDGLNADGRKFRWWHTMQFIRTNSDFTKLDDIKLIDANQREGKTLLLTNKQNEDGTWDTAYMSGPTKSPESHFQRLIDLNGVTRDTLTNGKYNIIQDQFNTDVAPVLKGKIIRRDTDIDDQDNLFTIAVHEMEIAGAIRQKEGKSGEEWQRFEDFKNRYIMRKQRAMAALAKDYGIKTEGLNPNDVEKMLSDRLYHVQIDGSQQTLTMREVTKQMGARLEKTLRNVFDVHIEGKAWIAKYLRQHIEEDGEISLKKWSDSLKTMFQRALPDSDDQHIPHDPGRLFAMENEILFEARRLVGGGDAVPSNPDVVSTAGMYHDREIARMAMKSVDWARPIEDVEDAKVLSRLVTLESHKNRGLSDAQREGMRDFADYLHKELPDRDMRTLWQDKKDYSQFENDLWIATNDTPSNRMTYTRRRLRDNHNLIVTERLEGAFPHMDHDRDLMTKDAAERIRLSKDDVIAGELREEVNSMLVRKTTLFESSDAFADYMLDDNTGAFLSRFREDTFGSAMSRGRNWDGYRTDAQVLNQYARQLGGSSYNNIAHTLSRNVIRSFENSKTSTGEPVMGEHNKSWGMWQRIYVRDTMGKASTFTPEVLERLNIKNTPYYWLSDHLVMTKGTSINRAMVRLSGLHKVTDADRAIFERTNSRPMTRQEEKDFEKDAIDQITKVQEGDTLHPDQVRALSQMYKGAADLEAKYEMMALLFHAKSYAANVIGGTINTVAHTGYRPFKQARDITYWSGINPEFKSMANVDEWVSKMGVIENYIIHEAGITGLYREGKWKQFLDEVTTELGKGTEMKNRRLYEIAKKNGITQKAVDSGAWFMRESEKKLRTRSFLAGYIKARQTMAPMDQLPFDHPALLDQARKTVAASQFLYGASERPAFARTNFGKVFSRFKLWGWSSPKMRREIYQEAETSGFAVGSEDFKKLQRIVFADLMAISLASLFPFSLFEYTLPPPFSWFSELADYFFGDGYEKDSAFFSSPLGPINEITPVILSKFVNVGADAFRGLVTDEVDTMSTYQLATLFPFGRIGYDVVRTLQNPNEAARYLAGIPLREFAGLRDDIMRNRMARETGPVLEEAFRGGSGLTEKEVIGAFEGQGREALEARAALRTGLEKGYVQRSLEKTSTGRAYVYTFDRNGVSQIDRFTEYGAPSLVRGQ
tara:strand:+ start:10455 stop:20156 length:9702 start_codon:yes stop_codon:yes gene_type:complete